MSAKNQRGSNLIVLMLAIAIVGYLTVTFLQKRNLRTPASQKEIIEASGVIANPSRNLVEGVQDRMDQVTEKMGDRSLQLETETLD